MDSSCEICSSLKTRKYTYNNHLNKINIFYIRQLLIYILINIFFFFNKRLKSKVLFTSTSNIKVCSICGFGKYLKKISEDDLRSYYSISFWDKNKFIFFHNEDESQIKRAKGQFEFIKDICSEKSIDILEIGAGSASLSKMIKDKNSSININLVEPGTKWEEYYKENDLKKVSDFYPDNKISNYDLIIASHWLEHTSNLDNTLKNLKKNMRENAKLFIEVPNCDQFYWRLDIKDIPHTYFFTEQSLQKLFISHGFEILNIKKIGITNTEFYNSNIGYKLSEEIIAEIDNSIINNISRDNGNCMRLLLKKI